MKVLVLLVTVAISAFAAGFNVTDPVEGQLFIYKEKHKYPTVLTTSGGAPVSCEHATSTLNTNLINNEYFLDLMSNLIRERTPERTVHAKGTGAFGYFKVTNDITHICKADFLKKIGKKTPIAMRFSTSTGSRGSSDVAMGTRGYSVKFYTHEGNFDIPGFNTPIFSFKEPLLAHNAIHTSRPNPATNALDSTMNWERIIQVRESIHILLYTLSGRGLPASYRYMPGFGVHTYQVENKHGEHHFVRFHFLPDAGTKNLSGEEALKIGAVDLDYLTKDLYRAISNGDFPSWTLYVQILNKADLEKEGASEISDVTRIIPEDRYPLHKVGVLVLNKNAKNFFAEIEQLAFCPGNLVPGILGGLDILFQARRLIYRDAQHYRLGGNVRNIPVNCPLKANTYNRDGNPPVTGGDGPNYYPNSFNGPEPYKHRYNSVLLNVLEKEADNFDQATNLYANGFTAEQRTTLIGNIVASLKSVAPFLLEKALELFAEVHPDLGNRIALGLNRTITKK